MQYRILGRTGLRISTLGFGSMRLPMTAPGPEGIVNDELAIPMIHRAFELGVNYIDSAVFYCNNDSQRAVGEAVKAWGKREEIVISTKNNYYGLEEKPWWDNLEESLRKLQVSCIDIYNFHGLNRTAWGEFVSPKLLAFAKKAKDQGMIRHIAFSFHDTAEGLRELADQDFADSVTLQYHLLDRQLEDTLEYVRRDRDMGIVVMGPVSGGRLGDTCKVMEGVIPGMRVPEMALNFVLSNPNVTCAISGMQNVEMVERNCAVASAGRVFTSDEKRVLLDACESKLKAQIACTSCNYCQPCPVGIAIPRIFGYYNNALVYGTWDNSKESYQTMPYCGWSNVPYADICTKCGLCETKCPQHLPIRDLLERAHRDLSGKPT